MPEADKDGLYLNPISFFHSVIIESAVFFRHRLQLFVADMLAVLQSSLVAMPNKSFIVS